DREQLCRLLEKCVLRCEVILEGDMQVYDIEVEITDVNDNAPSFNNIELEEKISEMTAPGSRFPLAGAHDPDSGPNSVQSYELSGDEHFSLAVQAGPGGDQRPELVLAKALDREEAAFHELVLRASDGGEPARTGTARIRVAVLDANDNAPVFSQAEYTVRVPEDVPVGSTLVTVTAADPDEGLNGNLKYSLKKATDLASEIFHLDAEKGAITLVRERLDREEMCGEAASCSVSFEALVENPLNVFHVEVAIQDVNDNSPTFSKAALALEINELTSPGARFPLEVARDVDVGSNSLLTYQLTDNPAFTLTVKESPGGKKHPELLLERALDREKQSSFQLVLTVVDDGDPVRSGTIQVRVNVTDANDNAPVFSKSVYEARVRENVPAGSLVLRVRATDADAGSNGRVSYFFSNVPDGVRAFFSVDSESGEVRTAGPLDFEEKSKYSFGLEARDGGGLTGHCEVQINITDENDNAPEI
ncbi:PCDG2 protein, partial [Caloenas nicobarica]|nr:PCDG2 protein [Caloenas nicobarica]